MHVLSGSMRPALEPGDIIIAREVNPKDIKVNDIITYRISQDILVTHRVVDIVKEGEKIFFRTKGDANNSEDRTLVPQEQLVGRLAFKISKGGYN